MAAGIERFSGSERGDSIWQSAAAGAQWLTHRIVEVVTKPLDMTEDRLDRLPVEVMKEDPVRYAGEAERAAETGESELANHTVTRALHSLIRMRDSEAADPGEQAHIAERVMEATDRVRAALPPDELDINLPDLADGVAAKRPEDVVDNLIWGPVTEAEKLLLERLQAPQDPA